MAKTIAEIWEGDLFNRREEAANLEAYIESIWQRPSAREDSEGFVLAVDADYGMGKTFFLEKFAEQLAINHPVAYIDAWKDDLQDEPLIALVATLEEALEEAFGEIDGDLAKTKDNVWDKFKKVSGIVGKGLLKKGAGLIITASAAEAVSTILEGQDEDFTETIKKELEDVGKDTVNGVVSISKVIGQSGNLEEKIKSFKNGQKAIEDLKKALAKLVKAISKDGKQAPIVIIIDELDRCRPNYAIKLLEEVKHLFDVKGIVFILGMNIIQTCKSVKNIYGSEFNSEHYLSRFYSRKYKLAKPENQILIEKLLVEYSIPLNRFFYHNLKQNTDPHSGVIEIINSLLDYFEVSPRDFFKVFRILQTTISVTKGNQIFLPQLMILIIKEIKGESDFKLLYASLSNKITFTVGSTVREGTPLEVHADKYFSTINDVLAKTTNQLYELKQNGDDLLYRIYNMLRNCMTYRNELHDVRNYSKLINWVQRIE